MPNGNERLNANINGNAGGAANLSTMFPNQNIHKTLAPLPMGTTTNSVKVTEENEHDTFNRVAAL